MISDPKRVKSRDESYQWTVQATITDHISPEDLHEDDTPAAGSDTLWIVIQPERPNSTTYEVEIGDKDTHIVFDSHSTPKASGEQIVHALILNEPKFSTYRRWQQFVEGRIEWVNELRINERDRQDWENERW
jgi:hypothetical protein